MKNADLKKRILDISYKYKLAHIGSCLTAVDIIEEIYSIKRSDEKFVLSSGHAGLALYCVLEKYNNPEHGKSADEIWLHHGVHPDRCYQCGIDCSAGSLGHGLPIAVGMALADKSKNVYCLVSDGECSEGSIWEALRIKKEQNLDNLKVYCNFNGWAAYKKVNKEDLVFDAELFDVIIKDTNVDDFPFLNIPDGQQAHYHVMSEDEYKEALRCLK